MKIFENDINLIEKLLLYNEIIIFNDNEYKKITLLLKQKFFVPIYESCMINNTIDYIRYIRIEDISKIDVQKYKRKDKLNRILK